MTSPPAPDRSPWVAAIFESESGGHPIGTGVVVDTRRILTCAHVLMNGDSQRTHVWVEFPHAHRAPDGRWPAAPSTVAYELPDDDAAMLLLDHPVHASIAPARIRCLDPDELKRGRRWWAFGFPDGDEYGDSATGIIGEILRRGWVRLQCDSLEPLSRGFSGSGVWSEDYEAVVALIVQADPAKSRARAITLYRVSRCLDPEKLTELDHWSLADGDAEDLAAWGWSLQHDPEGVRHWRPRARGVTVDTERGYRFQGRTTALTEIVDWLLRPNPQRRALVVTGSPGVGKSAVLGRIVTTADPKIRAVLPADDTGVKAPQGSVGCAVHAKGKTAMVIATEIAKAASVSLPVHPEDLPPALQAAFKEPKRRFNVIIDALDEAADPAEARAVITRIVLPLVETCAEVGVQVAVGSRRHNADGDLIGELGHAEIIDLDVPHYIDEDDLIHYAKATLQLTGDRRPSNPYNDDAVAGPVAARIAALADGNFLLTGLIARTHGLYDDAAVPPAQIAFSKVSGLREALGEYVSRGSAGQLIPAELALTALAMAEAPGFPLELWRAAIEALSGPTVDDRELLTFARSSMANFLVETSDSDNTTTFRLFHQALNDALLAARAQPDRVSDERAITTAFTQVGRRSGWTNIPAYLLRSLPGHAARAGLIAHLATDNEYLLHADLPRLTTAVVAANAANLRQRMRLLQVTRLAADAPPSQRAAMFSVTEAIDSLDPQFMTGERPTPYRAIWATITPHTELNRLNGHTAPVNGLCALRLNDRDLLATGSDDHTVRIWDPTTGAQLHQLGHSGWVNAVCALPQGDRDLLASASHDQTVRIWDPATGAQLRQLTGHAGWVNAVCALRLDDRDLLVTASTDQTVRIWDPATGDQLHQLTGHSGWVNAVCALRLDDRDLLVTTSTDQTVRIWDPTTGDQLHQLTGYTGPANAICALELGDRTLLAAASTDHTIGIWDPATGDQLHQLTGYTGWIRVMCALQLGDRALLATASTDHTIGIWDAITGDQLHQLTGHTAWVRAICPMRLGDRTLLATTSDDHTVRIWDPATGTPLRQLTEQAGSVNGVCSLRLADRELFATGSHDHTVRIWDPTTGAQLRQLSGHGSSVTAICALRLGDRTLLASASSDHTVRIWDPGTGAQVHQLNDHTTWIRAMCALRLGERTLLATGSDDETVRIWDPATGTQLHQLKGHTGAVIALCTLRLGDRTLLATGSYDESLRIWDPATATRLTRLDGHTGGVNALCTLRLGDRTLLAIGSYDGTLSIWDPTTDEQLPGLTGHTGAVNGVCAIRRGERDLLASWSNDRTVRIWDLETAREQLAIPVHYRPIAAAVIGATLVVGLDGGLLGVSLDPMLGRS
ncbi:trypsin-like peptidase domain-containing protein [Streptosporangiaceae bacterium NEAU-GS5]|nr:trypsin-like peptidase domain-containing protein [Streptosporangiaceae bacterium NEAU-GS5]